MPVKWETKTKAINSSYKTGISISTSPVTSLTSPTVMVGVGSVTISTTKYLAYYKRIEDQILGMYKPKVNASHLVFDSS